MSRKSTATIDETPAVAASTDAREQGNRTRRGVSVNRVTLVGRLTRDAVLTYTSDGTAVTRMRVATNVGSSAEFHDLVAWRQAAEFAGQYLSKGRLVYLEGHLRTSSWVGDGDMKRSRTEIVVDALQALDAPRAAGSDEQ